MLISFVLNFAQTAMKWTNAFALIQADPNSVNEIDFEHLIDITNEVRSGEAVVGSNGNVQNNREHKTADWN